MEGMSSLSAGHCFYLHVITDTRITPFLSNCIPTNSRAGKVAPSSCFSKWWFWSKFSLIPTGMKIVTKKGGTLTKCNTQDGPPFYVGFPNTCSQLFWKLDWEAMGERENSSSFIQNMWLLPSFQNCGSLFLLLSVAILSFSQPQKNIISWCWISWINSPNSFWYIFSSFIFLNNLDII